MVCYLNDITCSWVINKSMRQMKSINQDNDFPPFNSSPLHCWCMRLSSSNTSMVKSPLIWMERTKSFQIHSNASIRWITWEWEHSLKLNVPDPHHKLLILSSLTQIFRKFIQWTSSTKVDKEKIPYVTIYFMMNWMTLILHLLELAGPHK